MEEQIDTEVRSLESCSYSSQIFAEILNRIRTGNHSEEDMIQLRERVRPKQHKDLKDKDALYLFGKNKPVDEINTKRILMLSGEEFQLTAQ